jgi:hypothetical protein
VDVENQGEIRDRVGPGNPPVHSRFQPGQSGNPGGRPRGQSLTSRIREALELEEIAGKKLPRGKRVADLVVEALLKEALKGKFAHLQEVIQRTDGKVPDKVEHGGVNGAAIEINTSVRQAASEELEAWRKHQIDRLSSMQSASPTRPTS